MPSAVIITAPRFQDEEFIYPYYRLQEADCHVDVATPGGDTVHGEYGTPARATMRVADLDAESFDLVVIPGGVAAPDKLRAIPEVVRFVADMFKGGKLLAAMCHGPWVLINAGVVKGKRVTAYPSLEEDLRNAGAHYEHKVPVVRDGNIITSPIYTNNPEFLREIVRYLATVAKSPGMIVP
ncbi:MAG TPA: type 1 glutamine amidotransferase domain-containing protein [Deltaproteobacteria bacterium]|nr:type 1 glutamine amidotransferase domain-containing protein [Deltaproteobacteria bacterium]HOI07401.1 type 1 glutamine amidotransferase domain-containing protein [Deltaproteobacteria bacterium]